MALPALPVEIWRLIVDDVAEASGEHWCSTSEETRALRAMSHVNSSLRPFAMRNLWRTIWCQAAYFDLYQLEKLQRVIDAVHQGCKGDRRRHKTTRALPRKATNGRCLGPCEYIECVHIDFSIEDDDSLGQDMDFLGSGILYADIATNSCHPDGQPAKLTTLAAFEDFLVTLAKGLQSCHQFDRFAWVGQFRPAADFYRELSKCSPLSHFSLELGPSCLPSNPMCSDSKQPKDHLYLLADLVTDLTLGFGADDVLIFQRDIDLKYPDITRHAPLVCQGLVKWLSEPNKLVTLEFAAPILLYQPWLLPLWAQLDFIQTELQWSMFLEDSQDEDDDLPEDLPVWGEKILGVDMPYEFAATAFRYLLKQKLCNGWDQDVTVPIEPKQVFDLIHAEEDLEPWREWFPIWPEDEPADDRTVKIMTEVAARINPKPLQIEGARPKRGVKRARPAD